MLPEEHEFSDEFLDMIKSKLPPQNNTPVTRQLDLELRHLRSDIDKLMVEVQLSQHVRASSNKQTNTMNESPKNEQGNDRKKVRPKGRKYSEEKADIFIVELDQLLDEAETQK